MNEPTPLQKAVEEVSKDLASAERTNSLAVSIFKNHCFELLSAAKQPEALTKERDALKKENEELKAQRSESGRDLLYRISEIADLKLALKKCAEALDTSRTTFSYIRQQYWTIPGLGIGISYTAIDNNLNAVQEALSNPLVKQLLTTPSNPFI